MAANGGSMSDDHDPKELVRRGYDDVSYRYRADDDTPQHCPMWIANPILHPDLVRRTV